MVEEVCNGSNGVETEEETVKPVEKDAEDDAEESTAAGEAECDGTGNGGGEPTTINLDEDSNISKATNDVITVEDTGEGNVPSQTVPDVVFYDEVSEEEKQYYSAHLQKAKTGLEMSTVQCTACWKQVNHHVMNNIMRHPLLGVPVCRACRYFYDGDGSGEAGWDKAITIIQHHDLDYHYRKLINSEAFLFSLPEAIEVDILLLLGRARGRSVLPLVRQWRRGGRLRLLPQGVLQAVSHSQPRPPPLQGDQRRRGVEVPAVRPQSDLQGTLPHAGRFSVVTGKETAEENEQI